MQRCLFEGVVKLLLAAFQAAILTGYACFQDVQMCMVQRG
jgi:hypothetical protein